MRVPDRIGHAAPSGRRFLYRSTVLKVEATSFSALIAVALITGCAEDTYSLDAPTSTASTVESVPVTQPPCVLSEGAVVAGDVTLPGMDAPPEVLVDRASGEFYGNLVADGTSIPMVLLVDASLGEYRYTEATWEGDPADPAAATCQSWLEVDFAASADADGWLNTSFSSILVFTGDSARFESPVPLDQVEGTVNTDTDASAATDLCFIAEYTSAGAYWDGSLAWRHGETGMGDEIAAEFVVERVDTQE